MVVPRALQCKGAKFLSLTALTTRSQVLHHCCRTDRKVKICSTFSAVFIGFSNILFPDKLP